MKRFLRSYGVLTCIWFHSRTTISVCSWTVKFIVSVEVMERRKQIQNDDHLEDN